MILVFETPDIYVASQSFAYNNVQTCVTKGEN